VSDERLERIRQRNQREDRIEKALTTTGKELYQELKETRTKFLTIRING